MKTPRTAFWLVLATLPTIVVAARAATAPAPPDGDLDSIVNAAATRALATPGAAVRDYAGTYQQPRSHVTVTISEREGNFTAKPEGLPTFTLLWEGEDRFLLREDAHVEILFMRAPEKTGPGQERPPCRALVRVVGGLRESAVRKE